MAVALEELIRFRWSPSSRRVVGKDLWRAIFPRIHNRVGDSPRGFHHVRAVEQRRIFHPVGPSSPTQDHFFSDAGVRFVMGAGDLSPLGPTQADDVPSV